MYGVNAVAASKRRTREPGLDYYADNGCEVARTCLECPLSRCKFDDMAWFTNYRRLARDFRIAAAIHSEGISIKEAALRFSLTPRTIFRVLNRCRNAMQELTPEEAEVFASLVLGKTARAE